MDQRSLREMSGNLLLKDIAQKWYPIIFFQISLVSSSHMVKLNINGTEKKIPPIVNHGKGREKKKI